MATVVDLVNRALIETGFQKQISSLAQDSPEAQVAAAIYGNLRDELLRMAPWNCATNTASLSMITAVPGTPENQSAGTNTWQKGQPIPPWYYEYQYPVDCLRPLFIIPQFQTGFVSGVPITTAITGGMVAFWNGPPVRFRVGIDQFVPVTSATVSSGGTGHAVGDLITLAAGPVSSPPIGAPAVLLVTAVSSGVITAVSVVNQIQGEASPLGGSYFAVQANPVLQGSSTGLGTGASFNLTFGPQGDQRVIATNQETAAMVYIRQVLDWNVMDPLFIDAYTFFLASRMIMALRGDIQQANMQIQKTNTLIIEARKADGNEGLTINDVTPDWIRIRGIDYPTDSGWTPNMQFDWGNALTLY